MGNSASDEEFFRHFGFLIPGTVPSHDTRPALRHSLQSTYQSIRAATGVAGLKDFPGECVRLFESHWLTVSLSLHDLEVSGHGDGADEEPRFLAQDDQAGLIGVEAGHGRLHPRLPASRRRKDCSRRSSVSHEDVMGADAEGNAIVVKKGGLEGYEGEHDPRQYATTLCDLHPSKYARSPATDPGLAVWQRYAEPVWWDIAQTDTLNERQSRDGKDEKHICPLQLGVIRRCLHLWSNPGDLVLSPFAGIGSEGVVALEMKRRFIGIELKRSYFESAARNLRAAEEKASQRGLFDEVPDVNEVCF